jgi:hypothetical protein
MAMGDTKGDTKGVTEANREAGRLSFLITIITGDMKW